uniref:AT1G06680 protein n=1 Tax=Arabidopsis thaliana TaxID=3702 RepID=C0Z3I6_ARATH|nr:AT1G06680 [Arabidopsis thaliana]
MAYSACFLHQSALASSAARSSSSSSSQRHVSLSKPVQIICKAQQSHEDDNSAVSRRLALTLLVGAAAVGSKVSPADAAYGEAGLLQQTCLGSQRRTQTSCHTMEMGSKCRFQQNGTQAKRLSIQDKSLGSKTTSMLLAISMSWSLLPTRSPSLITVLPKSSSLRLITS